MICQHRCRPIGKKKVLFLSLALCLCVLLATAFQQLGLEYFLSLGGKATPTNVYAYKKVDLVSPEMEKLLHDDGSKFWDCDLPATPCRYFHPRRFFQEEAKAFQKDYKKIGGTNNNLPAITALSWYISTSTPSKIPNALPHNIPFIRIHKSGGTTVKTLLAQTKESLLQNFENTQVELSHYKYSFGGGSLAKKELNRQKRQAHIEGMVSFLKQPQQAVVFAIVRDPLERFVSAVQQVMHYNDEFRQKCLKWTARSTLLCAIQNIRDSGKYLGDVHLIPMATHFRLWDQYPKAQIAVLHLQDIHVLAKYLGVVAHQTNATTTMPHARDRAQATYATSKVLANMNVKRDCTTAMLQDLCHLYAIDVMLLKSLGYGCPYCG